MLRSQTLLLVGLVAALLAAACAGTPSATPTATGSVPTDPAATPTTAPTTAAPATGTPVGDPTATVAPSPSTPPITVSPDPSVPATASPGADAIARFLAAFAEAQPPFHIESDITGHFTAGDRVVDPVIRITGDVSQDDFAGRLHSEIGEEVTDADVIVVGEVAYVRRQGEGWQVVPNFRQTQPLNPFSALEPADLAYAGPVSRSGTMLDQLRTTRWIGDEIIVEGAPDASLESSTFDIFVGADGIPVEADLAFTIVGTTTEGESARFEYQVRYRFSNVGDPVVIEAPEVE